MLGIRTPEFAAQTGDGVLDLSDGGRGHIAVPHRIDQARHGDDAVRLEEQASENFGLPGPVEPDLSAVALDEQRAQDAELHRAARFLT